MSRSNSTNLIEELKLPNGFVEQWVSTPSDQDFAWDHYRLKNPDFPHQSTADQFFDEAQFEAYRCLLAGYGNHRLYLQNA